MSDQLYKTLGVAKNASQSDIKSAYRKLMKKLHPDLHPDDKKNEARFKKVSAAYDIIGDENKRALYDRGEIDEDGNDRAPQFGGGNPFHGAQGQGGFQGGFGGQGDMNDLFSQMFRGRQGGMGGGFRQQAFKGEDRRYSMKISFLDAALGGTKDIRLADGTLLNVKIPRGIDDGKTIRLKGKGDAGFNGGPAGDAMIEVKIKPHPVFKRDGLDLEVVLPVTVYEAGLGAKIEVPTLRGAVGLNIPAGSTSGKVLRLKGRGIETTRKKGDQLVRLSVEMPKTIDEETKALLQSWQQDHSYDPRKKMNEALKK